MVPQISGEDWSECRALSTAKCVPKTKQIQKLKLRKMQVMETKFYKINMCAYMEHNVNKRVT